MMVKRVLVSQIVRGDMRLVVKILNARYYSTNQTYQQGQGMNEDIRPRWTLQSLILIEIKRKRADHSHKPITELQLQ